MYVTCMGALYKITKRNFKKYIQYVSAHGATKTLDDFTTSCVGPIQDLTDITAAEANDILKRGVR